MSARSWIISIISVLAIAIAGICLYIFWPAITGTVKGSKYYTAEEIQQSYDKGFNDGNESKTEMQERIDYYTDLVDQYYLEVEDLNTRLDKLSKEKASCESQIETLTNIKNENERTIENLTAVNAENEKTIANLNKQVNDLTSKLQKAMSEIADKDGQIEVMEKQIANLQATITQLQAINEINLQTITTLKGQIATLNSQITELQFKVNNNSSETNQMTERIEELEKTVKYYEDYVKTLESGENVTVTFEFNGSVINVQVIKKGSKVSIVDPESTDYVIFNYWTANGEQIDLNNYTVQYSVKIVANVTYKYDVKFMADGQVKQSSIVEKGQFASAPEVSKDGYEFDGWSVNGKDIVQVDSYAINETTTFVAKFTKLHNVTFMYETETKSTQQVRDGEYASNVRVDSTTYKIFNGWKVNNMIVSVESYKIVSDTTFIADITYKYDVKFMVDDGEHNSQIVESGHYAIVPQNPSKIGYKFIGWTINGNDVVNVSSYAITNTTTFIAKFAKLYVVQFKVDNVVKETQYLDVGEKLKAVVNPSKTGYEFDGWTINGNDIVDLGSYDVTGDVDFIAKFTKICKVSFNDGVKTTNSEVRAGSTLIVPQASARDGMKFEYWTIDGTTQVDMNNYKTVTTDLSFIARYSYLMDGTYNLKLSSRFMDGWRETDLPAGLKIKITNGSCTFSDFTYETLYDNAFSGGTNYWSPSVEFKADGSDYNLQIVVNIVGEVSSVHTLQLKFDKWTGTWNCVTNSLSKTSSMLKNPSYTFTKV